MACSGQSRWSILAEPAVDLGPPQPGRPRAAGGAVVAPEFRVRPGEHLHDRHRRDRPDLVALTHPDRAKVEATMYQAGLDLFQGGRPPAPHHPGPGGLAARTERTDPDSFSSLPQPSRNGQPGSRRAFELGTVTRWKPPPRQCSALTPARLAIPARPVAPLPRHRGRSLPELSERDVRRAAALLRVLGSARTWLRVREEYGLDGAESGSLVTLAIGILEEEIRRGNLPAMPG